ncbi:hypothetical protein [Streptomyces sp. NPDC029704]|uniref:hypothetical protein n=1 Tax=Streptomyces sp. NPDC029704 TaxID=3156920 RepID=UPI0033E3DBAE
MGYDMHIHGPMTDEEEAAYRKAHEAYDAAVRERDELPAALPEYQEAKGVLEAVWARQEGDEEVPSGVLAKTAAEAWQVMRDLERSHPGYPAAQQKVDAAYEALQDADISYFRLNIHDMGVYRTIMDKMGMLVTDYDLPDFPELPDGVTWKDVDAAEEEPTPGAADGLPVKAAAAVYAKELNAHLAWHPEPASGIAAHKLGSNSGWLVTPDEIEAALASYRTHSALQVMTLLGSALGDDNHSYWTEWITYLERARVRGGFTVR